MAAETAQRIRVTPVDAFTCRGRRYNGTVVLNRADFAPEWRDAWMLTDTDRDLPANRAAGQIAEAEKELAMLRAEHARFLKAAGGEQ